MFGYVNSRQFLSCQIVTIIMSCRITRETKHDSEKNVQFTIEAFLNLHLEAKEILRIGNRAVNQTFSLNRSTQYE